MSECGRLSDRGVRSSLGTSFAEVPGWGGSHAAPFLLYLRSPACTRAPSRFQGGSCNYTRSTALRLRDHQNGPVTLDLGDTHPNQCHDKCRKQSRQSGATAARRAGPGGQCFGTRIVSIQDGGARDEPRSHSYEADLGCSTNSGFQGSDQRMLRVQVS